MSRGNTADSEIFARVYFRETSRMRSFAKIEPSRTGEITLLFTDVGTFFCKSRQSRGILNVANMSLNAIRENKIIAKISEFTVIRIELAREDLVVIILSGSEVCANSPEIKSMDVDGDSD